MSSRDEILASIRKNTLQKFDYPTWKVNAVQYPDLVKQFISISAAVGGEAVELPEGMDVNEYILKRYPNMNAIASNMPEITCATMNPDDVEVAQDLNGTDLAVVKGEIGVAENGCVWIPQTVKHKIIYFAKMSAKITIFSYPTPFIYPFLIIVFPKQLLYIIHSVLIARKSSYPTLLISVNHYNNKANTTYS